MKNKEEFLAKMKKLEWWPDGHAAFQLAPRNQYGRHAHWALISKNRQKKIEIEVRENYHLSLMAIDEEGWFAYFG